MVNWHRRTLSLKSKSKKTLLSKTISVFLLVSYIIFLTQPAAYAVKIMDRKEPVRLVPIIKVITPKVAAKSTDSKSEPGQDRSTAPKTLPEQKNETGKNSSDWINSLSGKSLSPAQIVKPVVVKAIQVKAPLSLSLNVAPKNQSNLLSDPAPKTEPQTSILYKMPFSNGTLLIEKKQDVLGSKNFARILDANGGELTSFQIDSNYTVSGDGYSAPMLVNAKTTDGKLLQFSTSFNDLTFPIRSSYSVSEKVSSGMFPNETVNRRDIYLMTRSLTEWVIPNGENILQKDEPSKLGPSFMTVMRAKDQVSLRTDRDAQGNEKSSVSVQINGMYYSFDWISGIQTESENSGLLTKMKMTTREGKELIILIGAQQIEVQLNGITLGLPLAILKVGHNDTPSLTGKVQISAAVQGLPDFHTVEVTYNKVDPNKRFPSPAPFKQMKCDGGTCEVTLDPAVASDKLTSGDEYFYFIRVKNGAGTVVKATYDGIPAADLIAQAPKFTSKIIIPEATPFEKYVQILKAAIRAKGMDPERFEIKSGKCDEKTCSVTVTAKDYADGRITYIQYDVDFTIEGPEVRPESVYAESNLTPAGSQQGKYIFEGLRRLQTLMVNGSSTPLIADMLRLNVLGWRADKIQFSMDGSFYEVRMNGDAFGSVVNAGKELIAGYQAAVNAAMLKAGMDLEQYRVNYNCSTTKCSVTMEALPPYEEKEISYISFDLVVTLNAGEFKIDPVLDSIYADSDLIPPGSNVKMIYQALVSLGQGHPMVQMLRAKVYGWTENSIILKIDKTFYEIQMNNFVFKAMKSAAGKSLLDNFPESFKNALIFEGLDPNNYTVSLKNCTDSSCDVTVIAKNIEDKKISYIQYTLVLVFENYQFKLKHNFDSIYADSDLIPAGSNVNNLLLGLLDMREDQDLYHPVVQMLRLKVLAWTENLIQVEINGTLYDFQIENGVYKRTARTPESIAAYVSKLQSLVGSQYKVSAKPISTNLDLYEVTVRDPNVEYGPEDDGIHMGTATGSGAMIYMSFQVRIGALEAEPLGNTVNVVYANPYSMSHPNGSLLFSGLHGFPGMDAIVTMTKIKSANESFGRITFELNGIHWVIDQGPAGNGVRLMRDTSHYAQEYLNGIVSQIPNNRKLEDEYMISETDPMVFTVKLNQGGIDVNFDVRLDNPIDFSPVSMNVVDGSFKFGTSGLPIPYLDGDLIYRGVSLIPNIGNPIAALFKVRIYDYHAGTDFSYATINIMGYGDYMLQKDMSTNEVGYQPVQFAGVAASD